LATIAHRSRASDTKGRATAVEQIAAAAFVARARAQLRGITSTP
jgi:hypothetical protein